MNAVAAVPLVVDLDGTLVKAELPIESVPAILRQRSRCLFSPPLRMLHGKARFKRKFPSLVSLDLSALSWRTQFIDRRVAGRLNLFDTDRFDLTTGRHKRDAVQSLFVLAPALYVATDNAEVLYAHPHLLWVLCPLPLYRVSHISSMVATAILATG
jgi:hypothetical protein